MRKLPLVAALGALLVAPSVASAATLKIDVVSNRADLISAGDALVEAFAVRALGGADTITVNDLAGTGVETVGVDLPADGQADTVVTNGTDGADAARVSRSGAQARVRGLGAETRVAGGEPALDALRVQTLAGDDEITLASNVSDLIGLVLDLGADD